MPRPVPLLPLSLLLVLLLLPAVAACGGASDLAVTRRDSAGVAIVTTAGPDRPLDWQFEERLRLGGAESGPASFYSISRGTVATDAEGAIYVLDQSANRVVVFDAEGRHLRTLGREGGGPGELEMAAGVAVDSRGTVGVWDYGKSGVVRFGPDGTPLPTFVSSAFYRGRGLALRPDGAVFTTTDARERRSMRDALVVFDTAGGGEPGWPGLRTVTALPIPEAPMQRFPSCGIAFRLPPLFYPDVEWAPGPGGRLYVTRGADYVVEVYADTARVASWRRDLAPRPATRELAVRSLGEGMTVSVSGGPPCTIPPDEVLDARGFADRIPVLETVMVDPAGRVWVRRAAIGDDPVLTDILGPDGAYLGTLTDAPEPVAFLPDGDLLAVETNDLDVDQLVVYRVVEGDGE